MLDTAPIPEDRLWRESSAQTGAASHIEERVAFLWQRANLDPESYPDLIARVKASGWRWEPRLRNRSWYLVWQLGGLVVGTALAVNLALASLFKGWNSAYQSSVEQGAALALPSIYEGRGLHWKRPPTLEERAIPLTQGRHRHLSQAEIAPALDPSPFQPSPALPRSRGGPPDVLGSEAADLAHAMEQLNGERDPQGALATLVVYFHRYPAGILREEATLLAVDANLAAGRRSEALSTLDQMWRGDFVNSSKRSLELRLLRAELLADDERCGEALPAFQDVLALKPNPLLQERALYGAAQCYLRLGDLELGRGQLENYLRRFPQGRYAPMVRAALAR